MIINKLIKNNIIKEEERIKMPRLRENLKEVLSKPATSEAEEKQPDQKNLAHEYSRRSPILKAYQAGQMPIDHQRLLSAIKEELGDGAREGTIQLEKVLKATGYMRASALKMLKHMQNFGVLETEPRYRSTWVKLLKDVN